MPRYHVQTVQDHQSTSIQADFITTSRDGTLRFEDAGETVLLIPGHAVLYAKRVEMEPSVRKALEDILFRYSEWLDGEGITKDDQPPNDPRSHLELVADFLASNPKLLF